MLIYIFLLLIIWLLLYFAKKNQINKKTAFIFIAILFVLIVGMRNVSLGQFDTELVYKPYFYRILHNDLSYIFNLKDIGFQYITYLFTRVFGDNFQLYIFLLTIPYISGITFFIYKYSKYPMLSFVFFICLQYFEISFTLIRQVNAMAILMLATYFLIEKKKKISFIFILIASLFHQTSLVYILMLPLCDLKIKKKYLPFILLGSFIFLFLPTAIMNLLYKILGTDNRFYLYSIKGQQKTYMFYLLNLIIWLVCILGHKFSKTTYDRNIFIIGATVVLYISPLAVTLGEMSRIAYYFGLYEIIIFPDICSRFNGRDRMIFSAICSVCLILYFFSILGPGSNVIPYIPFFG